MPTLLSKQVHYQLWQPSYYWSEVADSNRRSTALQAAPLDRSGNLTSNWHPRRESNPHHRIWRPVLCQLSFWDKFGGCSWNRTSGRRVINAELYLLSYATKNVGCLIGFEPMPSGITIRHSAS